MITKNRQPPPQKRLALFFDGTWNKPDNHTNVYRLFLMLDDRGEDGMPQRAYYDTGVGTNWFDRVSGGAIGWGLSKNVCEGYRWLMENYDEGDEIFIFGFSRGAFTARSLAGLIARCGLLKPDAAISFQQLYERYQRKDATPIYELRYQRDQKGRTDFDFEERTLLDHSYYGRNLIKMVGVWDTVGALGLPFGNIPGISSNTLRFHNTHLSTIVQNSFHAMALDEHRGLYWAMLWTNFVPSTAEEAAKKKARQYTDNRFVEQRWFSGAHCDVGGGYRNDAMSQRPLQWLQARAMGCQLGFRSLIKVDEDEDLACTPRDSYKEFLGKVLGGAYRLIRKRYTRWVQSDRVAKENGFVHTVNERIDPSVLARCARSKDYRPEGLRDWAKRKGLDLEAVVKSPEMQALFCAAVTVSGIERDGAFEQ